MGPVGNALSHGCVRYPDPMANTTKAMIRNEQAGLCADCIHARQIESSRGSTFVLCEMSQENPQFAKYPRLPVLSCRGYAKNPQRTAPS